MEATDVTIVIPVYNRAGMLAQALESCRRQTAQAFEVLIFDNCSTEDLRPVINRFANQLHIRHHRHDAPVPPVNNFVLSSEAVTTNYMKFLCSDDVLFPHAVEAMLVAIRAAPGAAVCIGGYVEFHDAEPGAGTLPALRSYFRPALPERNAFSGWLRWDTVNCMFPSSILYDARRFHEVGGFHTELQTAMDWEVYLALLARFPVVKVDEVVCAARLHAGQWLQEAKFTQGAQSMHDVLLLTSDHTNPRRGRLGLPAAQQAYLRQQTCWAALRNVLASGGKTRMENLRLWLERVVEAGMTGKLLAGAPFWAACKLLEKLVQRRNRLSVSESVWPDQAERESLATLLREILDVAPVPEASPPAA